MVVLKELISISFYFGQVCGVLERTDFVTVPNLEGCGSLEGTDFEQFLL